MKHRTTGIYIRVSKNMVGTKRVFIGFQHGEYASIDLRYAKDFAKWLRKAAKEVEKDSLPECR